MLGKRLKLGRVHQEDQGIGKYRSCCPDTETQPNPVDRMVLWKQYIILFGGFIDVGIRSMSVLYRTPSGSLSVQRITFQICGSSTQRSTSGSR